jgi:hypothetical protein
MLFKEFHSMQKSGCHGKGIIRINFKKSSWRDPQGLEQRYFAESIVW